MRFAKTARAVVTALAVILVVVQMGTTSSHGQTDQRNFWLLNNTGKKISRFYVSPHERKNWGKDILGRSELPTGIGTVITFDPDIPTSCVMDFRLIYDDDSEQTYVQGRNVCLLGAVQFNRATSIGLLLPEN